MGGLVKKIAPIAVQVGLTAAGFPVAGQIAGGVLGAAGGTGASKPKTDPSVAAAQQRQADLQAQQQAAQLRLQQQTEQQQTTLSGSLAAQRRAVAARARGRNSLSFSGSTAGLSTKLGGS